MKREVVAAGEVVEVAGEVKGEVKAFGEATARVPEEMVRAGGMVGADVARTLKSLRLLWETPGGSGLVAFDEVLVFDELLVFEELELPGVGAFFKELPEELLVFA